MDQKWPADKIAAMDTGRATCFGAWADEYHDWRPTYPDAAVDWLLPPDAAQVAEVGAGTGKLTDRLVERDLELDVVEPDGRMLRVVERRHPGLRTHERERTDLPLGDASVDAVLVADAWHWFPKAEAAAEVARVLRPGGWLGCVWNVPALEHDWEWRALRLDPALRPPRRPAGPPRARVRSGRAAPVPVDVGPDAPAVGRLRVDGLPRPPPPRGRVRGGPGRDRAACRGGLCRVRSGHRAADPRRVVRALVPGGVSPCRSGRRREVPREQVLEEREVGVAQARAVVAPPHVRVDDPTGHPLLEALLQHHLEGGLGRAPRGRLEAVPAGPGEPAAAVERRAALEEQARTARAAEAATAAATSAVPIPRPCRSGAVLSGLSIAAGTSARRRRSSTG